MAKMVLQSILVVRNMSIAGVMTPRTESVIPVSRSMPMILAKFRLMTAEP